MKRLFGHILNHRFPGSFGFRLSIAFLIFVNVLVLLLPWLPLPFKPNAIDLNHPFLPPLSAETTEPYHWLGTDQLGRDVLANILYGFGTAFRIAIPVILIAIVTGILAGGLAGFYGNRKLKVSLAKLTGIAVWLFLIYFYFFYVQVLQLYETINPNLWKQLFYGFFWLSGITAVSGLIYFLSGKMPWFKVSRQFPLDGVFLKITEILASVPRLVLVLCMAALVTPGAFSVILVLSVTFWVSPARLIRAEVLKVKQLPFIEAAQASGLSDFRILIRQVLPNVWGAILTAFCFGLAKLLSLEATLAFLGIGLPPETPSWGRLMASIRLDYTAWWLLLFPGLTLIGTILAIQNCGNFLQKALTKR